jgi:DNA-binding NtrC family response regulator/tetratricopeptide (TPR) repeat protein
MQVLMHDRYLVTGPNHARDLATGSYAPADALGPPAPVRPMPRLEALFDSLDYARDGQPQRRVIDVADRAERRTVLEALASGAQHRGYVPIAVAVYRQVQHVLADELRDRAIVLLDADDADDAWVAGGVCLMALSATSPRPHVLVTVRSPQRAMQVVREARALFGAAPGRDRVPPHPDVVHLQARAARMPELVARGRHAAAERLSRDVATGFERRRAFVDAARVWRDLGWLLVERGRLIEAYRCGGNGARLSELGGDAAQACEARLLQGMARLEQAQVTEAEAIARGVLLCAANEDVAACARALLAKCLVEQRRLDEARDIDLSLPAAMSVQPRWLALITDAAVLVLIETGRLSEAGARIRASLNHWPDNADALATAIIRTAHLRVVVCTGDDVLAGDALHQVIEATRLARAPLRALRARAILCAGLMRGGSGEERAGGGLPARLLRIAPPLLVRECQAACQPGTRVGRKPPSFPTNGADRTAAALVALGQRDDDDEAVESVLTFTLETIDAVRVDVISAQAGPPSVLSSAGHGRHSTLGTRILESGIAIGFESGSEAGVPVRMGPRLVAALVARWPDGRLMPACRQAVLECAAAVLAARVEGLQQRTRENAAASVELPELLGVGTATRELRSAVMRAARAPFSVLIEGESGVGKELVARAIHHLSVRRERRFCDVNCAALPEDLFETEVFGHAKGAFTGAVSDRAGLFEEASGGTLFLDEIADLSLRAQAKLLRAVQQQEVRRVGESFGRSVDVRLVAAANRQMTAEVEAGRFRGDLLYRLDVIHIRIAPLRERPEDIPVIAQHVWRAAAARVGSKAMLAPATLAALTQYGWPGNVRELQNVIAALAVAAPAHGRVRPTLLPAVIGAATTVHAGHLGPARDQFERRFIEVALARTGGNRTRAARAVGLSRQGLLKSMARLGLGGQDG